MSEKRVDWAAEHRAFTVPYSKAYDDGYNAGLIWAVHEMEGLNA